LDNRDPQEENQVTLWVNELDLETKSVKSEATSLLTPGEEEGSEEHFLGSTSRMLHQPFAIRSYITSVSESL
jgi:hypothetical protein